jgi:hypothetical protein
LGTVIVLIHFTFPFAFINLPQATFLIVFFLQPLATTSKPPSLLLTMASFSSSASSAISFESESSREPTPKYDPITTYEILAPLHWDAEKWDYQSQSEDGESLTDGEDLTRLLGAELEEDDKDDASWEEEWQNRLNYSGSSALVIAKQLILT